MIPPGSVFFVPGSALGARRRHAPKSRQKRHLPVRKLLEGRAREGREQRDDRVLGASEHEPVDEHGVDVRGVYLEAGDVPHLRAVSYGILVMAY